MKERLWQFLWPASPLKIGLVAGYVVGLGVGLALLGARLVLQLLGLLAFGGEGIVSLALVTLVGIAPFTAGIGALTALIVHRCLRGFHSAQRAMPYGAMCGALTGGLLSPAAGLFLVGAALLMMVSRLVFVEGMVLIGLSASSLIYAPVTAALGGAIGVLLGLKQRW